MRALIWNGVNDLRVETVKDPEIVNPHDAILRVTMSTTCGSDLHFIDGYIPTMKAGDVIGHEFMGVVEDVGPEVKKVKKGDRVVVPSFIVCGQCWYCKNELYSLCDNTHPKPELQEPHASAIRPPASTAIPTRSAATPERTPSMCACRLPTTTASRCRMGCRTSRCCSSRMRRRPATWGRISATSSRGDMVAVWGCGGVG